MTDRPKAPLGSFDDARLETALRELAVAIDWPVASPVGGPDVAVRVRVRLTGRTAADRPRRWSRRIAPLPRALVLALVALLALAAIAGAVRLGLPGLRIVLGDPPSPPPTVSPSATAAPGGPGSDLGLGRLMTLDEARTATGRALPLPTDPRLGPPDAVYVDATRADQVALVWAERASLPRSGAAGVGLILMSFDGTVQSGYFTKITGPETSVEPIRVGEHAGFWIHGDPHLFFYQSANGVFIPDERRWIGDALLWSAGPTTYRIESALGRDATIALAASIP